MFSLVRSLQMACSGKVNKVIKIEPVSTEIVVINTQRFIWKIKVNPQCWVHKKDGERGCDSRKSQLDGGFKLFHLFRFYPFNLIRLISLPYTPLVLVLSFLQNFWVHRSQFVKEKYIRNHFFACSSFRVQRVLHSRIIQ